MTRRVLLAVFPPRFRFIIPLPLPPYRLTVLLPYFRLMQLNFYFPLSSFF